MVKVNNISRKCVGRRSGREDTRGAILEAAQKLFAKQGLDQTTMRQIGEKAGVDPSLIVHYFKTKQALFVESMHSLLRDQQMMNISAVLDESDTSQIGERLAAVLIKNMINPATRDILLGLMRSATSDKQAVMMLQNAIKKTLYEELKDHLPKPDGDLKASLITSQFLGIMVLRYVVKVEPMASASTEKLIDYLSPQLQLYFDESAEEN